MHSALTSIIIPSCVNSIEDEAFGYDSNNNKIDGFVIMGEIGSEAQRYAEANDIEFVAFKMGDVNSDGVVSIFDVTEIQKYAARFIDFTELQLMVSDVNHDGHVDVLDATLLQRYVAGFDVSIG